MDSLVQSVEFGNSSKDINELLKECRADYDSQKDSRFVGICISECDEGYSIKGRNNVKNKDELMIALQGAINLFFAEHPQEDDQ